MAAAASPDASAAYVGPTGTQTVVPVGTATYHFLNVPMSFRFVEFAGIAFLVFIVARHWGKFVNTVIA